MTSVVYTDQGRTGDRTVADRPIALWLLFCCGMVFAMAVIGAITRLTESGLSMVEWKPLIGIVPPLSDAEWRRVFDLYRQTPEYRLVNVGMSLDAFKYIFFWEWFHRVWGRLIGLAFLIPFVWFAVTRRIPRVLMPKLLGLFALGGLQGVIGWYMVKSGLVDQPAVSHYRLALHLGTAFLIYGLLLWTALGILTPAVATNPGAHDRIGGLKAHAGWSLLLVAITVVWGAFVAGLDAGLVYNTWPLMNGYLLPPEVGNLAPLWLNAFENTAGVQFTHRWIAIVTGVVVLALAVRIVRSGLGARMTRHGVALGIVVLLQIGLGILTLVLQVPIPVAAAHQAGALVLITSLVWTLHDLSAASRMADAAKPAAIAA